MSKDDTKLPNLKGGKVFEGEIYFDPQNPAQETRKRSQSLPNIKLEYEEFHDAVSDESSLKSRTNSETSLGSTSEESYSSNEFNHNKSVKSLKSFYEKPLSPKSSKEKPTNTTKGISGIYAGKDIEQIRATIRDAVDPHTYQKEDSGEIKKGHYGHRNEGKCRI